MGLPITSILRTASRKENEPLNILTFPTHERGDSNLCKANIRVWSFRGPGIKDWNTNYAPVPENYVLLDPSKGLRQLPPDIEFDLILSQNKFGQIQLARQLSQQLHLPLISLEHTLPPENWSQARLAALKQMKGHLNVFISEYSRDKWKWAANEAIVIHHGIDTETFSPNDLLVEKRESILSVVNDWISRDWCCGYNLWQEATKGLPVFPVGDTPGLSKPARSVPELVMRYREARVFINTSLVSPIPTALLEAMSVACPCVSTNNCMIPEIIEHGVNGFLANDAAELRYYSSLLLKDHELGAKLGAAARETIKKKFSLTTFVENWNRVFRTAADLVYIGE